MTHKSVGVAWLLLKNLEIIRMEEDTNAPVDVD